MPLQSRAESGESSCIVNSVSTDFLSKKKEKGIMTSLKRFLGRQQRAADSAAQLGPTPSRRPIAPGSSEILPAVQQGAESGSRDFDVHPGCQAPPRSSASMPLLFPLAGPTRTALSSCLPSPLNASSGRRVVPTPSSSAALLQLPCIEPCAPPFSSGAMADRINYAQPLLALAQNPGPRHGLSHDVVSNVPADEPEQEDRSSRLSASQPLPVLRVGRSAKVSATGAATPTTPTQRPSTSTLLAMCPATPDTMRRPVWSLMDYAILARLYKGEVSSVYKAVCNRSGVKVALKVYSLSRVADNSLHTLVREVRIHTDLSHSNVLMLYGVFEEEDRLVLVLERAARGDLFHVHRSLPNCRMSEDQLRVLVLAPLLDALVYLHARGVCHRDIKPENLLMTSSWQLRLADFGAAINLSQERAVTRTGTMDYMAPEVERCPLKASPHENKDNPQLAYTTAADVWSVGVLAYELLVGFPPFIACSSSEEAAAAMARSGSGGGDGGFGKELCFPHFVSAGGQDFISCALSERPGDRPTGAQLLRHPWLKHAVRQYHARQQLLQQKQAEQAVSPIGRP